MGLKRFEEAAARVEFDRRLRDEKRCYRQRESEFLFAVLCVICALAFAIIGLAIFVSSTAPIDEKVFVGVLMGLVASSFTTVSRHFGLQARRADQQLQALIQQRRADETRKELTHDDSDCHARRGG